MTLLHRASLFLALLVFSILLSDALPIGENARVSPVLSGEAANSSLPTSGSSIPSPPKMVNGERPPVDSSDGENPSLLTSIPTFAPPGAIKKRRNIWASGINVPNPSISLGIPSVPAIRAYMLGKLLRKHRRTPKAEKLNPLPSAAPDAVQPQKAPVPDSVVNFVNSAGQQRNPNSANQMNNEAAANDPNSGGSANKINNALGYVSGNSANKFNNAIQNMASVDSATPTSLGYKDGVTDTSGDAESHSLSNSLGIISHSQFEAEDNGKKKRDQPDSRDGWKSHKGAPDIGDNGYREQTIEDSHVPTIWNGEVSVDDLDYWESEDLDKILALYDYIQKHGGKTPPSSSLAATPPPVAAALTSSTAVSTSMTPDNSSTPPPAPKSLAKAFGLVSHSSFINKTHRGNRREEIHRLTLDSDSTRAHEPQPPTPSLYAPLEEDNSLKTKRDDKDKYPDQSLDISDEAYDEFRKKYPKFFGGRWKMERRQPGPQDDPLEPVDISDEAYDEFRKKYPKFFGDGWKKGKRVPAATERVQNLDQRSPASPNWLTMLFSPSALLEKRPLSKSHSSEKRESSEETPINESLWAPNIVPIPPETPPSSPKGRDMSFSETSDTKHPQRQDSISQYTKTMTDEDKRVEVADRLEGWIKGYQDTPQAKGRRRMPALQLERRGNVASVCCSLSTQSDDAEDVTETDHWFESAFNGAWEEEHTKRGPNDIESDEWFESKF